ncbi:MAG TPA: RHS repeat-associated core domain-containing protein [Candidatus Binatia bacterium]|jgi:RHS repeat-associated protein|nr:RHS repeat-associated core domain-containing protein [Candidatus Binatia bacterium]
MKNRIFSWPTRTTSLLLVISLLSDSAPSSLWAVIPEPTVQVPAVASPEQAGLGNQAINQSPAPDPAPGPARPMSAQPTDAEISAKYGLACSGRATPGENQALAAAMGKYANRSQLEDQSALLAFLQQYPLSGWRMSLMLGLGNVWFHSGHFSKAFNAWEEVWSGRKSGLNSQTKRLADSALVQLLHANSWLGSCEELDQLLAEASGWEMRGGAAEIATEARETLWVARNRPEVGFKCGLSALLQLIPGATTNSAAASLLETKTTLKGISLDRLNELASKCGLKYQIVRRTPGSPVPLNSLVHLKLNHYAAITRRDHDRYLVSDPSFTRFYGQQVWMTKATLDEESDGYFLVPEGSLTEGWRPVTSEQAATVWGRGPTTGKDPNALTPRDAQTPRPCPHGMAQAGAHLMLVSLNLQDMPIGYAPPIGPRIDFVATYNQRDPYMALYLKPFSASNIGNQWTYNWFSYIIDGSTFATGDALRGTVQRFVPGGGMIQHAGYNSSTGYYTTDRDGCTLQYIAGDASTPEQYQLLCPDGSKFIYAHRRSSNFDFNTSFERFVMLTAVVDPAGNTVTLTYDSQERLQYITDAANKTTTFYYDTILYYDSQPQLGDQPWDPWKISRIQDPFGRVAYFQYGPNGELEKITDVIGMSSTFAYGPGDFLNQMTTPYGVSTFSFTESGLTRTLTMTDPNGDREYVMYIDAIDLTVNPTFPATELEVPTTSPTLVAGFQNFRNTFYFDKKAMSLYGSQVSPSAPAAILTTATMYHWLHDDDNGATLCSGILESIKAPLQSRIWFLYPSQNTASRSSGISLRTPSAIAREVENPDGSGTAVDQVYQFQYNSQGNLISFTDAAPLNRQTILDYNANGIDLLKVRQTTGGINDVLAEFGPYDAHHCPSTYIDASRQTWNLTCNSAGQLIQTTNPKSEVTRLVHDSSGYLQTLNEDWSGGTKTTSLAYDSFGRVHTVTDSEGYVLTFEYDALDRVTKVTYPDTTFEKYDYSRLDLIRTWDRAGHRTQITYDAVGRPLSVKDRLERVTQFSWCNCGGLSSITDPMTHITSWVRDLQGRVIEKDYQDGKKVHYSYEPRSGRLQTVTDPKMNPAGANQVKQYTYFRDDTLKGVTYINSAIATAPVSFTYDPNYRRLFSMTDGSGTTSFSYNPINPSGMLGAGRLAQEITPIGAVIFHGYDELGRATDRQIDNIEEFVVFDDLGRVTSHVSPLGTTIATYLNATPKLSSLVYPDQQYDRLIINFGYFNNLGDQRLQSIVNNTHNDARGPYSTFGYQYDVLGRIAQWTQDYEFPTQDGRIVNLENDREDQLLSATVSPQNGSSYPAKGYAYAYDASGNRTLEQIQNGPTYTLPPNPPHLIPVPFFPIQKSKSDYDSVNKLVARTGSGSTPVRFRGTVDEAASVTVNGQPAQVDADPASGTGGKLFTATISLGTGWQTAQVVGKDYDGANGGNVATKNYDLYLTGDVDKTFSYDDNGNRTGFTSASGNMSYEWDAEDRLVAVNNGALRSEFSYDGFSRCVQILEMNNGSTTSTKRFVWSGAQMCEERNANNSVMKRFYPEGEQVAGHNYYFTRDHLGSVRELVDVSGAALAAQYDYDPYGRRTVSAGGAVNADFGFTGLYYHAPSGLHLALFRAYDAETGRWLNRDPIAEDGGLNLYSYVANDPAGSLDPMGLLDYYHSSGTFLQPSGPVPYLEGDTPLGNIGAALYNAVPLAFNFLFGGLSDIGTAEGAASADGNYWAMSTAILTDGAQFIPGEGSEANAAAKLGKPSLSACKNALKKVYDRLGKLRKGKPGKFGSPQRGTPKKGYRLDPPHPDAVPGSPETKYHINWWDYTGGKKGTGGRYGAEPIE